MCNPVYAEKIAMNKKNYPPQLDVQISEEEMDLFILECFAVRRPLYIPSIVDTVGEVLSHSAVVAVCSQGSYLIEYMNDSTVHVKRCPTYVRSGSFQFEGLTFVHDDPAPQQPNRPVTIRRFSVSMMNYMSGKTFDTFTHNCHIARFLTMKKYGMVSDNPRRAKRNIVFQGFMDFFHRKRVHNIADKSSESASNSEAEPYSGSKSATDNRNVQAADSSVCGGAESAKDD